MSSFTNNVQKVASNNKGKIAATILTVAFPPIGLTTFALGATVGFGGSIMDGKAKDQLSIWIRENEELLHSVQKFSSNIAEKVCLQRK